MPVGDALHVDKVDHAAVDPAVQNIARAAANDQPKAQILDPREYRAEPQIGADSGQQQHAKSAE